MADEKNLTLEEPEQIRQQMLETRSALNDKLEALEQKVTSTVENAASSVSETVDSVKDSVKSSMDTVRDMFNLRGHVDRHLWPMMGGSLAVGFLLGWMLTPKKQKPSSMSYGAYAGGTDLSHGRAMGFQGNDYPGARQSGNGYHADADRTGAKEDKGSWLSGLASSLGPELDKLKGMAIGTVTGLIRDVMSDAIPEAIKPKVNDFMDSVTTKLGGEPIHGPVLSHFMPKEERSEGSYAHAHPGG